MGRFGTGLRAGILAVTLLAPCACLFETQGPATGPSYFPRSVKGLPEAVPMGEARLEGGDTLVLDAAPVKRMLAGSWVRMAAFNGSSPGPVLRVRQGDTVTVILKNRIGFPLTLHPHGIRLESRFDGAAGVSQDPVPHGGRFAYRLAFPDPGSFWYHSHVREDAFQILGLYGTIVVAPRDSAYWNPVDFEYPLAIGEAPLDSAGIAPIRSDIPTHALMGRFGNVFFANGDTDLVIPVKRNACGRFYVTNACNTRVLNLVLSQTWMKIVGSDNGRYETSFLSGSEMIAPGERAVFEASFRDPGTIYLYHATPTRFFRLARVEVSEDTAAGVCDEGFYGRTDTAHSVIADIDAFRPSFGKNPDKHLLLTGRMEGHGMPMKRAAGPALPREAHGPDAGTLDIEWTDTMGIMNSASTPENTTWIVRDTVTGLENHAIYWRFAKGERPLIRVRNDSNAVHSMPHPIHFHGQRFLVLAVNGKRNLQLAWKDTYLVPAASTVDLLLDASNPGAWMAHCHISEHLAAGMMFHFRVED